MWIMIEEAGLGFVGLIQLQAQLPHLEDGEICKFLGLFVHIINNRIMDGSH